MNNIKRCISFSNIKNELKKDGKYFITGIVIIIISLLIIITTYVETDEVKDFTLQLPGSNLFANVTFSFTIVLGILGILVFRNMDRNNIDLSKMFLILVIPLGILYCIVNPLGKIPDEDHHARKAMAISQGNFFSHANEEGKATDYFNSKVNELVTRSVNTYSDAIKRITAPETTDKVILEYTTMALYAPICHMPQAIAIFITRALGFGVTVQCYSARMANFGLAVFLIYKAIKLIPFKKHIIVFIALLPITMSELVSMSADCLTISMSIFYVSYILYLKYSQEKINIVKKDIVILGVTSIIVALCKVVYLPLCLLLFIIPKEKFGTLKKKNIILISIFCIATILDLVWISYGRKFLIEFNLGVNGKEQLRYILTEPFSYFLVLFRTIHISFQIVILSLFGEGLGMFNCQASVIFNFLCIAVFVILFFVSDEKEIKIDLRTKLLFFIVFSLIVVLIYTTLYIEWTFVRSPIIYGVQSRYLVPILLLLAIAVHNNKLVNSQKIEKRYLYLFMLFFNLNALACLYFTYLNGIIINYYIK